MWDRASGLREDRPGLSGCGGFADGIATVVRVTYEDRLTRFGGGWLNHLLAVHGAAVELLHPATLGGREEYLEGFGSQITTFVGRLYGMRSTESRARPLAVSGQCQGGGG